MTGAAYCPNGHPAQPGNRFCPTCGAAITAASPAAPAPPPESPVTAPPPAPAAAAVRPTNWLPVVIGGLALVAAIVVAVVVLTGDDGTPGVTLAGTTVETTPATVPGPTVPPTSPPATAPPPTTPETVPETPGMDPNSWTVLVYMIGDNNLEVNALEDLTEMAQVTPQERFDILVLIDRNDGEVTDGAVGLPDWTDTKLLHIEGDQTTVIAEYGEADMGDPVLLTEFITRGFTDYPAANTALILWDHGAALMGIGPDDRGAGGMPSSITPAELAPAIRQGLDAAGVERLDIIGFDACLMASLEIAVGVAPVARYMIASEEFEPGVGWDWTALEYLAVEPAPTAIGLGEEIIESYHLHPVVASIPEHTLSMVDLDLIAPLEVALIGLVDPLTASMDQYAPLLGRQRIKAISFGKNPDPWLEFHMVDLGHLAQRLAKQSTELADQAREVRRLLEEAVVVIANGDQNQQALGLTVFFPSFPDYWDAVLSYYDAMPTTVWRRALDAYFTTGRAIPVDRHPTFDAIGQQAVTEFIDPSGLHVSADFAGAATGDITEARLLLGRDVGESTVFYSDYSGEVVGSTATAVHGLEVVMLDDRGLCCAEAWEQGATNVFHRLDRIETEDGVITRVEIPLAYYPPGMSTESTDYIQGLYVTGSSGESSDVTGQLYVIAESGEVGSITPDPAGTLVPMFLVEEADGTRSMQPIQMGEELSADLENLTLTIWTWGFPDTELVVELTVTDYGGNSASASATAVVPADWMTAVG